MKDKLLNNLAKYSENSQRRDGTWGDKHTRRKFEERLRNGLNRCIKHRDFKGCVSLANGKIWQAFMAQPSAAFNTSYRGLALPSDCAHVAVYFYMDQGYHHWVKNNKASLTQINAIAVFKDTGEFVGFTPDSLYSNPLDTFCRNVFGKGSV